MTDASFRSALVIEDNSDQEIESRRKVYAPVGFEAKNFSPAQLKKSIYSKEFLAIYMAILEFSYILWQVTESTIVLTDNKRVTRFFQTKTFLPHGMHVIMGCILTLLVQSTLRLICSPDWKSKLRRRYVSKSGKISQQHLSK